jgi:hypothetical protein
MLIPNKTYELKNIEDDSWRLSYFFVFAFVYLCTWFKLYLVRKDKKNNVFSNKTYFKMTLLRRQTNINNDLFGIVVMMAIQSAFRLEIH